MYQDHLSEKHRQLIEKSTQDGLWNPDYVVYSSDGIKEIRCMRCGTPIAVRKKIIATCPNCGKPHEVEGQLMRRLDNFRQVRKDLENGTYIELMVCSDCETQTKLTKEEENERIMAQIQGGFIKEMEWGNKPIDKIKEFISLKENMKIKE